MFLYADTAQGLCRRNPRKYACRTIERWFKWYVSEWSPELASNIARAKMCPFLLCHHERASGIKSSQVQKHGSATTMNVGPWSSEVVSCWAVVEIILPQTLVFSHSADNALVMQCNAKIPVKVPCQCNPIVT